MIDSEYIDPLTVKLDKVEEMQSRMRGLAQAVKNLQGYDEWDDKTNMAWGNMSSAQGAVGTQVGHIGLNPNIYTTGTGTTTAPWQNLHTGTSINPIISNSGTDYNMKVGQSGQIDIQGKDADIRINGKSMTKWMEQVEQRLNILSPNPELEKEWDELRRLGERYRKLEKKCQDKARMWEALKKLPKTKS